jgi:putative methanogenesis marker protein 8
MYGTKNIDTKTVQKSVEKKIARFGFCCRNRSFNADPIVAYGASEMMSVWLEKGLIDSAVVVCEGAGTVITANSKLVQAIGARLTGIVKTSPIQAVIKRVQADGGVILESSRAHIDQVEGVKRALGLGFKQVAVSIAGFQAKAISELRALTTTTKADVLVFSVCNTCIGEEDVQHIAKADIACASASKVLRREVGKKALLQVGVTIPVYALTEKGKRLALAYLTEFREKLVIFRTKKLPYQADNRGPKLRD